MIVNKETIESLDGFDLSEAITLGKAQISVNDVATAIAIVEKLIQALAGRKQLRKRLEVLENIVTNQQKVIDLLAQSLPLP